jgi:propionyl-CoA carboxylase alpha chain
MIHHTRHNLVRESLRPMSPLVGGAPDASAEQDYMVRAEQDVINVHVECDKSWRRWNLLLDKTPYAALAPELEYYRRRLALKINGVSCMFRLRYEGIHLKVYYSGLVRTMEVYSPLEWKLAGYMLKQDVEKQSNVVRCPMPGVLVSVSTEEGRFVRKGQQLFTVESMKMESSIASPRDGLVERILVQPGQALDADDVMLVFGSSKEPT